MHIHLVAQSHIDPVFMWPWNEGLSTTLATCAQAVQLLGEYPELVFTRSDAMAYRWIQRTSPALFARISHLVEQRRWTPVGGWWTQADTNLPAGEGLIRQALYGQAAFREMFRRQSKVAYLVDSFGHPATLPKILAHCGFEHFVFSRPGEKHLKLPSLLFDWHADDGSRISSFRIPVNYCTYDDEVERVKHVTAAAREDSALEAMCFFGLGNHGGGPTRQQLERLVNFTRTETNLKLTFSDPERFFNSAHTDRLPVHRGPLEPFAIGCYSAAARLKRLHDLAQRELLLAETAIARLSAFNPGVSDGEINELTTMLRPFWEDLLFVQFHDLLPGTGIKPGIEAAEQLAGGARAKAEQVRTLALTRLTGDMKVSAGGTPGYVNFVVFNNSNIDQTVYFEYEPWLFWQSWNKYQLIDEDGATVPHQRIDAHAAAPGLTRLIVKLEMKAAEHRTLRVMGPEPDFSDLAIHEGAVSLVGGVDASNLRSPQYDLRIDARSGSVSSISHHASGFRWITPDLLDAVVIKDESDTWSLNSSGYGGEVEPFGQPTILPLEGGPLRWSTRIRRRLRDSQIDQEIRLFDESDLIEVRNHVEWRQPWAVLKVLIRSPFEHSRFRRGIAFGADDAPTGGREFNFQNWLLIQSLDDPARSLAILCGAGMHSADIAEGDVLRLTLVRSPVYCHEQLTRPYPPGARHEHMDMNGGHDFPIALLPLFEPVNIATLVERARHFDQPASIVTTHAHDGPVHGRASLVRIEPNSVACTALKPAEDGDGLIIRLWETAGKPTRGRFDLTSGGSHPTRVAFDIAPHALLTLRLRRDTTNAHQWTSQRCDGLEMPLK